jgi:Fe-S-cluster containining protein
MTEAARFFWNSPGMVIARVANGWRHERVRTITPRFENGKCIFFENGRCAIHPVAPFGCRYFDMHMDRDEGHQRAAWGVQQIDRYRLEYDMQRDALPLATHYTPRNYSEGEDR